MSSQESVTEASEPPTPREVHGARSQKRQKLTTPTAPGSTARRAANTPRARAPPGQRGTGRGSSKKMDNGGRYTSAELKVLERAVHAYRDEHKMSQDKINDILNSNAREDDFPGGLWDFICGALPQRERHSIQKAVKRKFSNRKRGSWSPEDDKELCELFRLYPSQWQRIGEQNLRGPEASRDRWRNYCKNGAAQEKGEWTKEQEQQLARLMRDTVHTLVQQRLQDIKAGVSVPTYFEPAELLDFGILSEKMGGTRSRLQCRNKFEKFKSRDDQKMKWIFQPVDALNGLAFEATTEEARKKSRTKSRKLSARMAEESEALHNFNEKMLTGDKYHILLGISRAMNSAGVTDETSIPWDDILEADHQSNWSILDRKTVLKQMQILYPAPDDDNCLEIIEGITEALEADYDEEELEQYYVERPHSTKKQRTYTKKASRTRNSIKVSEDDNEVAVSLPTPGSMDDDDEEDGV